MNDDGEAIVANSDSDVLDGRVLQLCGGGGGGRGIYTSVDGDVPVAMRVWRPARSVPRKL